MYGFDVAQRKLLNDYVIGKINGEYDSDVYLM